MALVRASVRHFRLRLQVFVESGGNFEDYIRFLSCHLFGPVNHGQNWKGWERSGEKDLIISDNQAETFLIHNKIKEIRLVF